ncbi:MAG: small multi-drug export protein [Planctomycetes bacterium]|nr:small multi-drug export protein [Planctomycetota bacterium]
MNTDTPNPTQTHPQSNDARETRRLLIAWIVAVMTLIGGTALWIAFTHTPHAQWIWGALPALVAAFPGKYLIFGTMIPNSPLGPWHLALLATLVDLVTALTLALGLGWASRFAWIRRSLKRIHDSAQAVLIQFPRFKRMAFIGVMFFVFLPLPASGAVGGTFVGQFLGLTRTAGVLAVTLGGICVSTTFALLANAMGARAEAIVKSPWVFAASVVVFLLFAWWAWLRVRAQLQKK